MLSPPLLVLAVTKGGSGRPSDDEPKRQREDNHHQPIGRGTHSSDRWEVQRLWAVQHSRFGCRGGAKAAHAALKARSSRSSANPRRRASTRRPRVLASAASLAPAGANPLPGRLVGGSRRKTIPDGHSDVARSAPGAVRALEASSCRMCSPISSWTRTGNRTVSTIRRSRRLAVSPELMFGAEDGGRAAPLALRRRFRSRRRTWRLWSCPPTLAPPWRTLRRRRWPARKTMRRVKWSMRLWLRARPRKPRRTNPLLKANPRKRRRGSGLAREVRDTTEEAETTEGAGRAFAESKPNADRVQRFRPIRRMTNRGRASGGTGAGTGTGPAGRRSSLDLISTR